MFFNLNSVKRVFAKPLANFPGRWKTAACCLAITVAIIPPSLWHHRSLEDILSLQVLLVTQSTHRAEEAAFGKYWLPLTEQIAPQWKEGLMCTQPFGFMSVYIDILSRGIEWKIILCDISNTG